MNEQTDYTTLAASGRHADAVVAYVERMGGGVSFVELRDLLTPSIETEGSYELGLASKNVVFWTRMSEAFAEAVSTALRSGRIHQTPTEPLVYLIDGGYLDMPLVKRPPKRGYKEPHWLPVAFEVGPHPDGREAER